MSYIEKASREQINLLPDNLEDYVNEDNPVRVIDAFVEGIDITGIGFTKSSPADTGRPAYDPRDILKLYIYGYFNRVRSSRKLMTECRRNVEVMWLIGKLQPDFRTIADFRKENAKALRQVFRSFVRLCDRLKLYNKELIAVDGSKFRAQNSDDKCFNAEILQRKLANIDEHIREYLRSMDKLDETEQEEKLSPEQVKAAIEELRARKEKYTGYLRKLCETGATQILETDPEARRMHTKDGFHCCYNVQTAVDEGSHMIAEYEVTNHNTDQGLLNQVCEQVKELLGVGAIEAVADKGYESREDIEKCLMNGTVPNVAFKYDKHERLFNLEYREAEITEETRYSTEPEDIQACLHAGVLPACYENTAVSVEVQELSAIGCFTRNADGTVTCPMGSILRPIKVKGTDIVYSNKDACRQCPNRCTGAKTAKRVQFGPTTTHVAVQMFGSLRHPIIEPPEGMVFHNAFYRKDVITKKVVLRIRKDKEKLKQRMCLSEHPFGTVKWYHGAHYLLCRSKEKVGGELGLSFLAYNLKRAINILGVQVLIEGIRSQGCPVRG